MKIKYLLYILKMSQFPLYTTLSANLPNKDLSVSQKIDVIKKISTMDNETHELIYVLIKTFYLENKNESDVNFSMPYGGNIVKDSIEFDLGEFPLLLRQLLYKFITIYKKKIIEDEKIKEIQKQ